MSNANALRRRSSSRSALAFSLGIGAGFCIYYCILYTDVNNAQIYDPAGGTFAATDWSPNTEANTFTLLADGRVLVTGVNIGGLGAVLYDPKTGTSSPTDPRSDDLQTATLLMDGNVLLTSADDVGEPGNDAELYTTSTGAFSRVGRTTDFWRGSNTATLLPDRTVLVTGGDNSSTVFPGGGAISSAELYNPDADGFSPVGSMTAARCEHTATLLPDGTVLLAGGYSSLPTPYGVASVYGVASAEVYKPAVLVPAPALFSLSGDGRGQGAIWHAQTGQIASADNPAAAGEALSMYTTSLAGNGVIPPQVAIGGRLAEVLYFGDAPCYPCFYQVNIRVPSGVAPGTAVTVRLLYLGRPSNEVAIAVQ